MVLMTGAVWLLRPAAGPPKYKPRLQHRGCPVFKAPGLGEGTAGGEVGGGRWWGEEVEG